MIKTILVCVSLTLFSLGDIISINGKEWEDNINTKTQKMTWYNAKLYCSELNLGGYADWTLPSINDLKDIVDINNAPAIKLNFKYVAKDYYWSNSKGASNSKFSWEANAIWIVGFDSGRIANDSMDNKYFVRCVRHRQ